MSPQPDSTIVIYIPCSLSQEYFFDICRLAEPGRMSGSRSEVDLAEHEKEFS